MMKVTKPLHKDIGAWVITLGLLMAVDSLMASSSKGSEKITKTKIAKTDTPAPSADKTKAAPTKSDGISADVKKSLFDAVASNDVETLEKLIKSSKVNSADIKNANDSSLLEVGIIYEGTEVVKSLLKLNFDPNYRDTEGRSYLEVATLLDNSDILDLLIKSKKFDINMQDAKGNTVLHNAVIAQKSPMIKIILKASPKKDIKNKAGETAGDIAKKEDYKEVLKVLK